MAKPLSWAHRIPAALSELRESTQETVTRTDVERLLGLQRRRAQMVLTQAGGKTEQGLPVGVATRDFILFLECICPQAATEERRRRKRFAQKLAEAQQEWIEHPPLFVEIDPRGPEMAQVREIQKRGLDALPEGITVTPEDIHLKFRGGQDALHKLRYLCEAISRDLERFMQMTETKATDPTKGSAA